MSADEDQIDEMVQQCVTQTIRPEQSLDIRTAASKPDALGGLIRICYFLRDVNGKEEVLWSEYIPA